MKIRTDFVTNSSSVCYVVAFKEKMQSLDWLKNELFPNSDYVLLESGKILPLSKICRTVFNNAILLTHREKINYRGKKFREIAHKFYALYLKEEEEDSSTDPSTNSKIDKWQQSYDEAVDKAIIGLGKFLDEHQEEFVYYIELQDNEIAGSTLLETEVLDNYTRLVACDNKGEKI